MNYRGRFAPTPSGPLHFGSIVAALGSYLQARTVDGLWFLRIDDIDPPRVAPGASDSILRTLERLGFRWDGAVVYQSSRREAYHAAVHRLRTRGLIYPCCCSRKEITDLARVGVDGPIYPGTCRAGLRGAGPARTLRVLTRGAHARFADRVQGDQSFDIDADFGDFTIYRADGVYAFHLASAVDDMEYGITEVVRGRDLLESSARQHWLIRALGGQAPAYVHLPLALGAQGEKLSKQTHATPVDLTRPAATVRRALAFLGHAPPQDISELDALWRWAIRNWAVARVPAACPASDVWDSPR